MKSTQGSILATHPLATSDEFRWANIADLLVQSLQSPSSLLFAISAVLGQKLCYTPLASPLFYPTAIVHHFAGDKILKLRRIGWVSPAIGISLVTLIGRASFNFMPNALLKGVIYGVHSCAIGMLTNISAGYYSQIIPLRKVLQSYVPLPFTVETLSGNGVNTISKWSEIFSSLAFITASLGLSFFGGFHVITANVIGHTAGAATKVVSSRLLAIFAEKRAA